MDQQLQVFQCELSLVPMAVSPIFSTHVQSFLCGLKRLIGGGGGTGDEANVKSQI